MLVTNNIAQEILFKPLNEGADTLEIISGYATPSMASWYIKTLEETQMPSVNIALILGMTSYDGLTETVHTGFRSLHGRSYTNVLSFTCSYVYENSPVRSNLYLWKKNGSPIKAFAGSADFLQKAFLTGRRELLEDCDPQEAQDYYDTIVNDSIYCTHPEVEDSVIIHPTHPILDSDSLPLTNLEGEGIFSARLSLLTRNGEVGIRSGLNWGQRNNRNKNEAYIPLCRNIARTDFFPKDKQHFMVVTDDGKSLLLRIEQQNDKAITTPLSNAQLGEYFRNRLGLANGEFITRDHLLTYGRTDVVFYKIDEEQYFMDFSPHPAL